MTRREGLLLCQRPSNFRLTSHPAYCQALDFCQAVLLTGSLTGALPFLVSHSARKLGCFQQVGLNAGLQAHATERAGTEPHPGAQLFTVPLNVGALFSQQL